VRRAAKIDANQSGIVKLAWRIGATVQSLAAVGNGCPDLLLGYRGVNYLVEVKDGSLARSRRQLNERQESWHQRWSGAVVIIGSDEELMALLCAKQYD